MHNSSSASICPACGAANQCSLAQGEAAASCWCRQSTALLPLPETAETHCYCRACLQKLAAGYAQQCERNRNGE